MTTHQPPAAGQQWQNGLLLTLLAWLLIGGLRNFSGVGDLTAPARLAHLDSAEAAEVWFFLRAFCLLAAAGLVARAGGIGLCDAGPVGVMLIVAFHFRPTLWDMEYGRIGIPLLALLGAAYLADSQDRPYRMAACIAAAGLIQPWMLALLLYLPLRRRTPAALWGVVLFAGMAALLLAASGFKDPLAALRALVPFSNSPAAGSDNHSIIGFARAQSLLDPPVLQRGFIAVAFLALVGGLRLASARVPAAGSQRARLLLGLFTVSLLLALPACRRAWFVLLLPALWTLLACDGVSALMRCAALVVYVVFAGSLAPPAYFLAAAGLWLVLVLAIGQSDRRRPAAILL